MTSKSEKLILDFKKDGWNIPNLYERLFELTDNSQDIYSFCKYFLNNFEKGSTIFNDSLSYIEKEQFAELIVLALDILKRQQKNENAEEVIKYASLQFPELLHEHLELIFNESAFCSDYPWRNLSPEKSAFYKSKLQNSETSKTDKQKLFSCLLETRDMETVKFAFQFALNTNLFDREDILIYYLEAVGFTIRNGEIESYCPNPTYHFCFPKKYFSDDTPIHLSKEQHPTWKLKSAEHKYKFGGLIEANENNPFTHIITFDPISSNIKISGLKRLTLGMHINEMNEFGPIFYRHDSFGNPQKIGETKKIKIYTDLPIKETKISFSETPKRWTLQSWGSSNSRENLFRLGGEPTWIQDAEVLTCPICNEKMDFLMQLDTNLPNVENGEVYFGSGGICYAFWCDKSKVSGYLMQCT